MKAAMPVCDVRVKYLLVLITMNPHIPTMMNVYMASMPSFSIILSINKVLEARFIK
jgi:hypothetical protein